MYHNGRGLSKKRLKALTVIHNYGIPETNALRDGLQHAPGVKNGRVLVIGSENPWAWQFTCAVT
jgi:hypothetical protein